MGKTHLHAVLDVSLIPLQGLKSQHVMRDPALESGPPSGTGKLIPLLLDTGTSRCTRNPQQADGNFPHLTLKFEIFIQIQYPTYGTLISLNKIHKELNKAACTLPSTVDHKHYKIVPAVGGMIATQRLRIRGGS